MVESARPKPDFRLMDLNYWCRRQMISHWDIKKQIAFSHCSKESFKLVKSLNQKPIITIKLDGWQWITVDVGNVGTCLIKLVDHEIAIPGYATPINFGLDARDAFVHLCELYHHKELTIRLNRDSITPLEAVQTVIDGFPIEKIIYSDGTNREDEKNYIKNMLESLPTPKMLLLSSEYETLVLQYPEQIDLLDLKAMNIEINLRMQPLQRTLPLNTQQFRGFIEKWIRSEAYPKFKTIIIHANSREVDENFQERILDGLLYQQLPSDWTCENVPHGRFWGEIFQTSGSFEVQREVDGQKAVISFATFGKAVLWKFFVV
ncbi:unnamed protein product [Caenorhabditis nigoni]